MIQFVAIALQTAAQNIAMFVVARMILGFGVIISASAGPILISELSPPDKRGWLVGIYFSMFQVGAIIASAVTYGTVNIQNTWAWRLPSVLQTAPALTVICLLPFVPESPRWKMMVGDKEYAIQVLRIFALPEEEFDATIEDIHATIIFEESSSKSAWKEATSFTKPMIRRFLIGLSLAWLVEMGGSSVGSYYLTVLLKQAGITDTTTILQINMISACWSFLICIIGFFFFDTLGRKKQALISLTGMIVCFFLLGGFIKKFSETDNKSGQYATIFWMFMFNAFYSFCYTPLTDMYMPEIYPTRIRVKGQANQRFFDGGFGLLGAFVLSIAMNAVGWKFYIINACYDILFLPVIYYLWVETKQLTLEEIGAKLGDIKIGDVEMLEGSSVTSDDVVERVSEHHKANTG